MLTQAFSWRATFWFLAIFVGACFLLFVPFRDTFRRERSLVYQSALRRRLRAQQSSEASSVSQETAVSPVVPQNGQQKKREAGGGDETRRREDGGEGRRESDVEKQQDVRIDADAVAAPLKEVKLSLSDVNPVKPIVHVLRRLNNVAMFLASGASSSPAPTKIELCSRWSWSALVFSCTYSITYTCSRTLSSQYEYDALKIGLTLLAFGVGEHRARIITGYASDLSAMAEAHSWEACWEADTRTTSTERPKHVMATLSRPR